MNRNYRDPETWGIGPWAEEENRYEWRDAVTRYPCLIVRNPIGALCGYVGVPPEHPAHGKPYDDVEVSVHGGLTYADRCQGDICHFPADGESDDVWWLGFDCAHYDDLAPGLEATNRMLPYAMKNRLEDLYAQIPESMRPTYKDVAYVRLEVEGLAKQLMTIHEEWAARAEEEGLGG